MSSKTTLAMVALEEKKNFERGKETQFASPTNEVE